MICTRIGLLPNILSSSNLWFYRARYNHPYLVRLENFWTQFLVLIGCSWPIFRPLNGSRFSGSVRLRDCLWIPKHLRIGVQEWGATALDEFLASNFLLVLRCVLNLSWVFQASKLGGCLMPGLLCDRLELQGQRKALARLFALFSHGMGSTN